MASILANTYLISNLRNLLKIVSRTCSICQRAYAKPLSHPMGMLPLSRMTPDMAFNKVGIDFAGPCTLRVGYTRKPSFLKCYAVVFVCCPKLFTWTFVPLCLLRTSWPHSRGSFPDAVARRTYIPTTGPTS